MAATQTALSFVTLGGPPYGTRTVGLVSGSFSNCETKAWLGFGGG